MRMAVLSVGATIDFLHRGRIRPRRLTPPLAALAGAVALAVVVGWLLTPSARATAPMSVRGEHFVTASGERLFLLGANYEGPADRAWQMWDDGRFDARLIAADLARARTAGLSVLRIFVQQSLADDIRAGRWGKLDEVLRLADTQQLKLVLTFADYPESRLHELAPLDTAVAARYRGRATIFAYDLKNEPRFGDLGLGQYPAGTYVALQDPALVPLVGQTIRRQEIAAYRQSDEGKSDIPTRLSDEQAYVYANMLAAYRRFLSEASAWAVANDSTSVAYMLAPDSDPWNPLKYALNDTLATWTSMRLAAIRVADPEAIVTIGHVDPLLASLPANNLLDYRTMHRYPSASSAGIRALRALFGDVRRAIPGKPLVLGEFGFSNATVQDEDRSAALEAELVREIREEGGAGALKWMLNDFPQGFNPRENAFGMFRGDGTPKPVVAAFRELAATLTPALELAAPRPADYAIPGGRFFTQGSGRSPDRDPSGFAVTNDEGGPFWDTWQRLGLEHVGYPLSRRVLWHGLPTQVFQKVVLQAQPDGQVLPINLFDYLHQQGADSWLETRAWVPRPRDPAADTAATWDDLVRDRQALLAANPAILSRYLAAPDPLVLYGLPTSPIQDFGDVVAVRTQRAVFLQWKSDVPWAAAGEVIVANGGEIAREAGIFPISAFVPEPPPPLEQAAPSER